MPETPPAVNGAPKQENGVSREELKDREDFVGFSFGEQVLRRARALEPKLWPKARMEATLNELKQLGFKNIQEMIEKHVAVLGVTPEKIKSTCETLNNAGLSNYVDILQDQPVIFSRSSKLVSDVIKVLVAYGFSNLSAFVSKSPSVLTLEPRDIINIQSVFISMRFSLDSFVKMTEAVPTIILCKRLEMQKRLEFISKLRLKDFRAFIVSSPSILRFSVSVYEETIRELTSLGFKPVESILESRPDNLTLGKKIGERVRFLKRYKVDAVRVYTKAPRLFALTEETIADKINTLRKLGLDVPKVVRAAPQALMLSIDTLKSRLALLGSLGFRSPVDIINGYPAAIGLADENITRKVRLMTRLVYLYRENLGTTEDQCRSRATDIIQAHPMLIGFGLSKLWTTTRVMRALQLNPEGEGLRVLHRLTEQNTEEVVIAFKRISHRFAKNQAPLTEVQRAELIKALFVSLAEVRSQKLTPSQRAKILDSYRYNNSDDSSEGDTLVYDTSGDPEIEAEYNDPKVVVRLVETYFRNKRGA